MLKSRLSLALVAASLSLALVACEPPSEPGTDAATTEPVAANAPDGSAWNETAVETPEGGIRIGNPEAPVKLVEFASHTCSHCATFSQASAAGIDEMVASGQVSYELRNLIRDPIDLSISLLARCGGAQTFHPLANQAWANFDSIMADVQSNSAALERAIQIQGPQRMQSIAENAGLIDFFAARGVARDQALQCLGDEAKMQKVVNDSQGQARKMDISGTPTFFINGKKAEGTTWDKIQPQLIQAGAR